MTVLRAFTDIVLVSGQIDLADAASLAANQISIVVNHRPDGEEPGQPVGSELAESLAAHGVEMVHAPFRGYPSDVVIDVTAAAIARAVPGARVLLFCRSGLRSTLAWALAERRSGVDADQLREAAAAAGYDLHGVPL